MPVVGGGIGAAVASFYDDSRARTGGGGGGAIKFDADGIDDIIKRLKRLIVEQMQEGQRNASFDWLSSAGHPVGDDYTDAVLTFGSDYKAWSREYVDAIKATIDKLEKVKADYAERDDEAARAFNGGLND